MSSWGIILFLIAVVFLVVVMYAGLRASDHTRIQEWAGEHNYQVLSMEECFWTCGPFWYRGEGQRIYEVKIRDEKERPRTAYFRFGVIWYDVEWYDGN